MSKNSAESKEDRVGSPYSANSVDFFQLLKEKIYGLIVSKRRLAHA